MLSTRVKKKKTGYASWPFPTLASPPPSLRAPCRCLTGNLSATLGRPEGRTKDPHGPPSLLLCLPYSPIGSVPWRTSGGPRETAPAPPGTAMLAPGEPTFAHAPPTKAALGRDPRPEKPKAHPQLGSRGRAHPTRRPPQPLPASPRPNRRAGPSGRPRWPPAPPAPPPPWPCCPLPPPPNTGERPTPARAPGTHRLPEQEVQTKEPTVMFT